MKENKFPLTQCVWTVLKLQDGNSGKTEADFLTLEVKEHIYLIRCAHFIKSNTFMKKTFFSEVTPVGKAATGSFLKFDFSLFNTCQNAF